MKLTCHGCEHRHCEYITNKPVGKEWLLMCPLMSPEEGPMPADWQLKKDRGE